MCRKWKSCLEGYLYLNKKSSRTCGLSLVLETGRQEWVGPEHCALCWTMKLGWGGAPGIQALLPGVGGEAADSWAGLDFLAAWQLAVSSFCLLVELVLGGCWGVSSQWDGSVGQQLSHSLEFTTFWVSLTLHPSWVGVFPRDSRWRAHLIAPSGPYYF